MRILMVHKTYKGGVAIHVREISKELRKKGFEIKEITRNEDLKLKDFITSYFKLEKLFKEWGKNYDVIHTHDWSITYPALRAKVKNLVSTFHAFPTNLFATYFENYCIKELGERAIVVSPKMKRHYPSSTYIPNGVNLDFFRKSSKIKREKNLLGIAQEYNRKKIRNIAKETNFEILETGGNLPFYELPKFYSKIEVFVSIPYKQTGFNMVWLEAMACEVPYIIGTKAGIGEVLPIYKVSNFDELKETLFKIKEGEIKPLKNQREWIIKNGFTWKNHVNKLVKLYEEVRR